MEIATYLQYGQFYGKRSTSKQMEIALRRFDRRALLHICGVINFALQFQSGKSSDRVHNAIVRRFFPADKAAQLISGNAKVFHRHQLLFLMQEIVKHCPELDETTANSPALEEVGDIFLMASDHLYSPIPDSNAPHGAALKLILELLPSSEANLFTNALLKMGRAHLVVSQIAERRRGTNGFFDIPELFCTATKIPFEVFEALMVGVFTRLVNVDAALKDATQFGMSSTFFSQTPVPQAQIDLFFSFISATPNEYASELSTRSPLPNDFRVIRDKPLARIGHHCFPLDAHAGIEKFDSAVYWSILNHLPEEQKNAFQSFWGQIFEDYVIWLLANSIDGRLNRLYPNPRYADNPGQQVCDAILICDRTAILIEIKGNIITSEGKYSGNIESLRTELERKYVGTQKNKKGVLQLIAAIQATCSNEYLRHIEGVDLAHIVTVIPLLITRDDLGGYMGVNAYLNARYKELLARPHYSKSVTSLLCLCADTIEKLSPYLSDTALSEFLSWRLRSDKQLRAPFFARNCPILEKRDLGNGNRQPTLLRDATFTVSGSAKRVLNLTQPATPNSTVTES